MHQALAEVDGRGRAKEEMRGIEGDSGRKETQGGRRKSSHAAWDKSFVALSDSQSISWCLLELERRGVLKREREKRDQENGHCQLPGAFTLRSSSVQTLHN